MDFGFRCLLVDKTCFVKKVGFAFGQEELDSNLLTGRIERPVSIDMTH